ncbi:Unknown protein, partial [Striga hermonthica]
LGIVLVFPKGDYLEFAAKVGFKVSNNETEYEAVIKGLSLAKAGGARKVQVHSDSQLVVGQFQEGFEVKEDRMQKYVDEMRMLKEEFDSFDLIQIPRGENGRADLLSKIAQSLVDCKSRSVTLLHLEKSMVEAEVAEIEEVEDWRAPILEELKEGTIKVVRRFFEHGGILYKRLYGGPHLRCVTKEEGRYVLREMHEGCYGDHSKSGALVARILRAGYFWPTMREDAKAMVKKCLQCQKTWSSYSPTGRSNDNDECPHTIRPVGYRPGGAEASGNRAEE